MTATAVELSGAVTIGICEVRAKGCVAATSPEPTYIVWERPSGKQIIVCGACLSNQFASGAWRQAVPAQPRLDLESLRHAVKWAAIPQNQATRSEMIAFLTKELATPELHSPSTQEILRGWKEQLEQIT